MDESNIISQDTGNCTGANSVILSDGLCRIHSSLVLIAAQWLRKNMRCGVVFEEFVTAISEIPDAFGLRSDYSILIECKASRSDFLADRKKIFRQMPEHGIGDFRLFLCPTGLIRPDELPEHWGLLYYDGEKVKRIRAPKGNTWMSQQEFRFQKNHRNEYRLLYSALRRIELRGDFQKIYDAA